MQNFKLKFTLLLSALALNFTFANVDFPAPQKACLSCHDGIEAFTSHDSQMAQQIYALGQSVGDPNGCVVCHGGNPNVTNDANKAHNGAPKGNLLDFFTPTPGGLSVIDKTCGACHQEQVSSIPKSMMSTDAGKIKVITYGWGLDNEDFKHRYANHRTDDKDGFEPIYGSEIYKTYMKELADQHKDQFPAKLDKIPKTDFDALKDKPELAVYNYLRNCNACHLASKGKQQRGHFRGLGCSACHVAYGVEGFYEGKDKSIDKTKPGHMLVHSMQGSRNSKVKVNGGEYSGIQISTCNACHSSGRRVSLQYQGLFPVDRGGAYIPFDDHGKLQQPNATYLYKHIKEDVHNKAGMLCQDCHTSPDMHGNGNIGTVALGDVEIECQDCHGTPSKYPWELKIGVGDELLNPKKIKDANLKDMILKDTPRGLAQNPMDITKNFAAKYDKKDGFLLSARGNPLGNVVKDKDKVILHFAGGKDLNVPLLKDIEKNNKWKSQKGRLAMVGASKHLETLECYACHATWASSYYGYDYSVDFSNKSQMIDWIESAEKIGKNGTPSDFDGKSFIMQKGGSAGDYSHARFEEPILGINGEGRITLVVGVIQTVGTVIDEKGKVLLLNNIAKRKDGMLTIDMQPLNPHTTTTNARECNECHQNSKTMGFGIRYGEFDATPQEPFYMGIKDASGKMLSKHYNVQINGIKNLHTGDFMQILDKDGKQKMRVDAHFEKSSPLTNDQIDSLNKDDYMQKANENLSKLK
ncbi:MAG: hypothetical protein LUC34_03745 [Campylobacter sp.]|nr:hypothetical protein [Campylobacter sp.]